VAFDCNVGDSLDLVARVNGASIVVIEFLGVQWSVFASSVRIARVDSAWVRVIASDWLVGAFLEIGRASVKSTCIVVIAVDCSNVFVDASSLDIARVVSAWVGVIAVDLLVVDHSSDSITPVLGACIVVIDFDCFSDALSSFERAFGVEAWVGVLAFDWSLDDSDL
jgi:hypothetical protein